MNTTFIYKKMAFYGTIKWYWYRFSVMSRAELIHRAFAFIRKTKLRMHIKMDGGLGLTYVRKWNPEDFSFYMGKAPFLSNFLLEVMPGLHTEDALEGIGCSLGHKWAWDRDKNCFHKAPDTGMTWPRKFYADIPHRPGNPYGDVRVMWEPNRLQHLVILALHYYKNQKNDPDNANQAARMIVDQVNSWWEQNPPLVGINYKSVMECALRIIALCHTFDLVRNSATINEDIWKVFLSIIYSHAAITYDRLSLFSSLGNHTIAECTGLIYASLLFPEFQESDSWYEKAIALLKREARHQILPDGGGAEQAIWYLRFIIDLYGLVIHLLRSIGREVPNTINEFWHNGVNFLENFQWQPGKLADFGDRDDGWALIPYEGQTCLFGGTEQIKSRTKTLEDSGYTVYRNRDLSIYLDHGPLGMAPSYGHGHADCLSIQLFHKDSPLLIDPGTYCYNCEAGWRSYFRSTMAHNTISVDGLDQAEQRAPFIWAMPFEAELLHVSEDKGEFIVLAKHNGYQRLSDPVTVFRGLLVEADGLVLVWDFLQGHGRHKLFLNWHIGDEWKLFKDKKGFHLQNGGASFTMRVIGGPSQVISGREDPVLGWVSKKYGTKSPINTLCCTVETRLPHEFITIISPSGMEIDRNECEKHITVMRRCCNKWSSE